jgi:hypothetical protein
VRTIALNGDHSRLLTPTTNRQCTHTASYKLNPSELLPGESPRGVSPRGARRTVRDTLASYGSHQGAAAHSGPVCEQVRRATGDCRDPEPCTLDTIAQLLVFLSGPFDQLLIQLADH